MQRWHRVSVKSTCDVMMETLEEKAHIYLEIVETKEENLLSFSSFSP